jgi:type VI protein secretion system component VasK
MPKLSEYAANAASEFFAETGSVELDARWIAEFFQNAGVADEYPNQDLIMFYDMVQKALTLKAELARKLAEAQIEKIANAQRKRP